MNAAKIPVSYKNLMVLHTDISEVANRLRGVSCFMEMVADQRKVNGDSIAVNALTVAVELIDNHADELEAMTGTISRVGHSLVEMLAE